MNIFKSLSRTIRAPLNRRWAFNRMREYHASPRTLQDAVWWAMNFGGSGYYRIKSLQVPSEINRLAEAVEKIEPKIILEIGTASAGTLLLWARIASQKVITCDLRDMQPMLPLFKQLPPPESQCEIVLLSGDSHSPEFLKRVEDELKGEKVDFLFIDGDHTEIGVTADFNDYRHLVRSGGLIAFHDIVESQPLPTNQVGRLWAQLKHSYKTQEFIDDPKQCGFGIGIIQAP